MKPNSSIHWSAYPALLVAGTFAVGIAIQTVDAVATPLGWSAGVGVGGLLFLAAEYWDANRLVTLGPLVRIAAIFIAVGCAGGASHAVYNHSSPRALDPIARATKKPVTVTGTVRDAPERSSDEIRFTLAVDRLTGSEDSSTVEGAVRVTIGSSPWDERSMKLPRIHEGDRLRLRGTIAPAPGQRNPSGFDYAAYLGRRGICCTMYVHPPEGVLQIHRSRDSFTNLIVDLRRHIRGQIRQFVPEKDGRTVLRALLLGDRSGITEDQRERFAQTGLMHLLAVSGLHVFLVGMVLYVLLQPLLLRMQLSWRTVEVCRAVLTVLVLGGYLLLTGARPSVVRAVVMSTLFIGSVVFQRSTHALNTLGVAALVLLAFRPPALFDAGFQLSMAAVAGIVSLQPRFAEWIPSPWRESAVADWLVSMVVVSAAATIGTAPVLLYHFGWVSVAGLLLNIVGIPCTGLTLTAAVAMEIFGSVWPMAGVAFGYAADFFVDGLLLTSRHGAHWLGWAGVRVSSTSPWMLGSLVASIAALAQWPRPRVRWRCVVCALLVATCGVWSGFVDRPIEPTLDLVFFDVGQGDAVLVSTPNNRHLLVDTGPRSPGGAASVEYSLLPYLRDHGIHHLDAVVISHPDEDHLGGLPTVLDEMSVGQVVRSGHEADTDLYRDVERRIDPRAVSESVARRGDRVDVGEGLRLEVLGPPADPVSSGMDDVNEQSVVVRLTYGDVHVLLPGDVEADAERALVRAYGRQLASHVVKVPHHGSKTSSTPRFVEAVVDSSLDTRAVVSVGRNNQFGMPNPQVVSRWQEMGASVASTATMGAVWLRSDGRSVWRVPWK